MKYKFLKNPGENTWVNSVDETPKEFIGFLYKIIEVDSDMSYIGIKKFWNKTKYPALKGRKNKRCFMRESHWRTYNSSNLELEKKILANPSNYRKVIVKFCETITDMKCNEAFFQLQYYVDGKWDKLFNQMVNLRVRIR